MRCEFTIIDGVLACSQCGYSRRWNKSTIPKCNCSAHGPPAAPSYGHGPGTEAAGIIAQLGGRVNDSCGRCRDMVERMNRWGVDGCRLPENRAAIIKQLSESAAKLGLKDWMASGLRLATDPKLALDLARHGVATDRPGAILELAIERASRNSHFEP